ncbi:hypothetical protein [Kocuria marina]|uniref:hypothetical protein n=1 Tax=Kocuria marina TaxID=223184 RepID=UPI0011A12085|nr:hypothetical protein [Kocuria indica]
MAISQLFFDMLPAIATVLGGLAALLKEAQKLGRKSERDILREDLDLLGRIPADDPRTGALYDKAYARLEVILNSDTPKARDWGGVALGLVMTIAFGFLFVWTVKAGGWWLLLGIPALFVCIVGVYGTFASAKQSVQ